MGGGENNLRLPKDIIKCGHMGEKGFGVKLYKEARRARKDSVPKCFERMQKGVAWFTSPLKNEDMFLATMEKKMGSQ
jgi:hypothetical protein